MKDGPLGTCVKGRQCGFVQQRVGDTGERCFRQERFSEQ